MRIDIVLDSSKRFLCVLFASTLYASSAVAQSPGHVPAGTSIPSAIKTCFASLTGDVPVSYTSLRPLSVKATSNRGFSTTRNQDVIAAEVVTMHQFGILGTNKATYICFFDPQMNFLKACMGYLKSPVGDGLTAVGCRLPAVAGEKTPAQQRRDARRAAPPAP